MGAKSKKRGQIGKIFGDFFLLFPKSGAWYQANQKLSSPSTMCHPREGPEGLEIVAFNFLKSSGIKPGILDDTVSMQLRQFFNFILSVILFPRL